MKKIFLIILLLSEFLLGANKILYTMDFTKQKDGDAKEWLKTQGFKFLMDMKDLSLKFEDGALVIETKGKQAGVLGIEFLKEKHLHNISHAKIEWGVERFPKGAHWDEGNNRVAIGIFFAFGEKKFRSGIPLVGKKVPYFLAPFIGEHESQDKMYLGALYKKNGRYYCVSNTANKNIKTLFKIDEIFQEEFNKQTPALSAFAIQMNTKDTNNGAKAFIKKITFYSKNNTQSQGF